MLCAVFVLLASLIAPSPQDRPTGAVEGRVVDREGHAVANAIVRAILEHGLYVGQGPWARTDESGSFILRGLMPGMNRLFPINTEAGYPDPSNGIFSGDASLYQDVEVEAGRTLRGVVLTLPPKGAHLAVVIVDDETNAPILTARIRITRADLGTDWPFLESGPSLRKGAFEAILTHSPFRVEVRAAGYQTWTYSGLDPQGRPTHDLVLDPETSKEIIVKLHKLEGTDAQERKK